jgi:hypothetical protein
LADSVGMSLRILAYLKNVGDSTPGAIPVQFDHTGKDRLIIEPWSGSDRVQVAACTTNEVSLNYRTEER